MSGFTFKANGRGIASLLLEPGVADLIATTADDVARDASAAVGSVNGYPTPRVTTDATSDDPTMRRDDSRTRTRVRSAVIGKHPTPKGRQSSRKALQRAVSKGRP